jgi:hypothetical protein
VVIIMTIFARLGGTDALFFSDIFSKLIISD